MNDMTEHPTRQPGPGAARFIRAADGIAVAGGYVAVVCLVLITLLMVAQVCVAFASKIAPSVRGDISIAWEYGSYLMGTMFLMASAITLRSDRHIRLGVVIENCPPGVRRVLEIFCSLIALIFTIYLTWAFALGAERAWMMNTSSISSETPLWIPLLAFGVGTALLAVQCAVRLLCATMRYDLVNDALRAGGKIME